MVGMKRLERRLRRLEAASRGRRSLCVEDWMKMRLLELRQEAGQELSQQEQADLVRLRALAKPGVTPR